MISFLESNSSRAKSGKHGGHLETKQTRILQYRCQRSQENANLNGFLSELTNPNKYVLSNVPNPFVEFVQTLKIL